MKKIFLITFLFAAFICNAQHVEYPKYDFQSTSSMQMQINKIPTESKYTVPFAAGSLNGTTTQTYNPRKVIANGDNEYRPGYNPSDPMMTPIGDGVIELLICSLLFAIYTYRKNKASIKD